MLFSKTFSTPALLTLALSTAQAISNNHFSFPAHYRDYFYVGGRYVDDGAGGHVFQDQMYVEHLVPQSQVKGKHPLVMIHGKAMTGTNFLQTPDGRKGWASYFLEQGYELYIIDQPSRGRSAWNPRDQTMSTYSAELLSQRFTAIKQYNLWPQSQKHTQWPGAGIMGDPIYDKFYASTVQFHSNDTEAQLKMKAAGTALLDKIGKAILVTHSQGGLYGWALADARPNLVKAIIALEPTGPSFREAVFQTRAARPWGLTDIPLTFEENITSASQLVTKEFTFQIPDLTSCLLQKEPAKKLKNLKKTPILIVTSEAGYHAVYDHCSYEFLKQAGCSKAEFMRLEEVGIRGNSHMFFMERNNLQIAAKLDQWIKEKL
ncbi:Alpha/Beta hydrolase protein [Kalaharituber pfeilii]|nr:Alpha/Beta hydrolase protein [Kalaharituber pfeilii]